MSKNIEPAINLGEHEIREFDRSDLTRTVSPEIGALVNSRGIDFQMAETLNQKGYRIVHFPELAEVNKTKED